MPWVKLDDQFFAHPKIVDLPKDAKLLYLAGLTHAAAQLTDGRLSTGAVRIVAAMVDVDRTEAGVLVNAGLWDADDDGYVIHDFLQYNRSADQVKADRARAAERQDRYRDRHNERDADDDNAVSNAASNGVTDEETTAFVTPSLTAANSRTQPHTVTRPDPKPRKLHLAAVPQKARAPDEHWDTMADVHGFSPASGTPEHGRWNKAAGIWRTLGASPAEMRQAYGEYPKRYPQGDPNALAVAGRAEHLLNLVRKSPGQAIRPNRDWNGYDGEDA